MFDGINSVSASDLTGSVIVLYAATLDIRRVEKCIERAVAVAVGPAAIRWMLHRSEGRNLGLGQLSTARP